MKSQIPRSRRQSRWKLNGRDIALTLLPILFWALSSSVLRGWMISPHCITHAASCVGSEVLKVDQFSLGLENMDADNDSHILQALAAALGIVIPIAYELSVTQPVAGALTAALTEIVVLIQVAGWNGVGVELSHLIAQRPRPFVYKNPLVLGHDPSHYTSFYSGHVSFVTAVLLALWLILFARGARARVLIPLGALAQSMVIATAYFRIMAGRHFLTDTVVGSLAGGLIALAVIRLHEIRRVT